MIRDVLSRSRGRCQRASGLGSECPAAKGWCDEGTRTWSNMGGVTPSCQACSHECTWPNRRTARTCKRSHLLCRCRAAAAPLQALDVMTVKWAIGTISEACRFFLNMQLKFLKKEGEPTSKVHEGEEWSRSITQAQE